MKKLKKYGFHHGMILMIISWSALFKYDPQAAIIVSASIATGYTFKEYNEGQWRGFKLMDISTWKDKFQWMDFITPCILSAYNIWIMKGM